MRAKPDKRTEPLPPPDPSPRLASQPYLARVPSTSRGSTVGLSSPSLSVANLPSHPPNRLPQRRARSPSQLTRAAEREAQILKRTLARKTGETRTTASRRRALLQDAERSASAVFPTGSKASSSREVVASSRRKSFVNLEESTVIRKAMAHTTAQSSSPHQRPRVTPHSTHDAHRDIFSEYLFEEPTDQGNPNLSFLKLPQSSGLPPSDGVSLKAKLSPPRTPPSRRKAPSKAHYDGRHHHHHSKNMTGSPLGSPSCDLDHLLSPSFLNVSPNSLLRKLNTDAPHDVLEESNVTLGTLSALPGSDPFASCEKIFLSSPTGVRHSDLVAPPSPTHGEPSKKAKGPSIGRGSHEDAFNHSSWNLNPTPPSASSHKTSIFSGAHPTPSIGRVGDDTDPVRLWSPDMLKNNPFGSPTELACRKPPPPKSKRIKRPSLSDEELACPHGPTTDSRISTVLPGSQPAYTSSVYRDLTISRVSMPPPRPIASLPNPPQAHIARTIWSRRLVETGAPSSEDSSRELDHGQIGARSASIPSAGDGDRRYRTGSSSAASQVGQRTGLSSAIRQRLQPGWDTPLSSERMLVDRSSPPVLPPPSDCSEGITPQSSGLLSEEGGELSDDELDEARDPRQRNHVSTRPCATRPNLNGSGGVRTMEFDYDLPAEVQGATRGGPTAGTLKDITTSLNEGGSAEPMAPKPRTEVDLGQLSPEILSAFRDALKAGWTPDDLAQALRTINGKPPAADERRDLSSNRRGD